VISTRTKVRSKMQAIIKLIAAPILISLTPTVVLAQTPNNSKVLVELQGGVGNSVIVVRHFLKSDVIVLNLEGDLTWSTNIPGPAGNFDFSWGPIDDNKNFLKKNDVSGAMLPVGGHPGPIHITDALIYHPSLSSTAAEQSVLIGLKITRCAVIGPAPNQSTVCKFAGTLDLK
jgi:hypothetical protein